MGKAVATSGGLSGSEAFLSPWVGVDGCRGGWVAVWGEALDGPFHLLTVSAFRTLRRCLPAAAHFWIDMPIGLPTAAEPRRACDRAARELLSPHSSRVFSPPARAALGAATYADACAANFSALGMKISRQSFFIIPKIAELDALLRADDDLRTRIFEAHPEAAFAALNDSQPIAANKKTAAGQTIRLALLTEHTPNLGAWLAQLQRSQRLTAPLDDVLDAAVLWLRATLSAKAPCRLPPGAPPRDAVGLPQQISY